MCACSANSLSCYFYTSFRKILKTLMKPELQHIIHIYVDGQNLFHSLKKMGIRERNMNWSLFFNTVSGASPGDQIVVFWYRPGRVQEIYFD